MFRNSDGCDNYLYSITPTSYCLHAKSGRRAAREPCILWQRAFAFTSIRLQTFIHQLSLIFDVLGSPKPHEVAHIRNNKAKRFLRSKRDKIKVMSSKRRLGSYGARSCSLHFVPPRFSCLARSRRESVVMNQFVVSTGTLQRSVPVCTGASGQPPRRSSGVWPNKASVRQRGPSKPVFRPIQVRLVNQRALVGVWLSTWYIQRVSAPGIHQERG